MAQVGLVAVDGTKMGAPASPATNVTAQTIAEQVEKMLAEAKATDEAEDALVGEGRRGNEHHVQLRGRADRAARFDAARKVLEEKAAVERAELAARVAEPGSTVRPFR